MKIIIVQIIVNGYVYKKNDKLKSKPVKLIKVINKVLGNSEEFNNIKKEFDERLGTSRKENINCLICITHNPYDVAGMSTDRNWTSCMELENGAYKDTPLKQVQYGGMCAYLIKDSDKNIEEPIARIAIKRLVNKRKFIFVAEPWIYGDEDFCDELDFKTEVNSILKKSNKETAKNEGLFIRKDGNSYSDSNIDVVINPDATKEDLIKIKEYLDSHPNKTKKILVSELSKTKLSDDFINILSDYLNWKDISQYQNLSEELLKKHANKVNWYIISGRQDLSEDFIRKHKDNINWNQLSLRHKNLSMPFIGEFINDLDLTQIIANSKLSEEFMKKHSDKLFGDKDLQSRLFRYQDISPELFEYLNDKYTILPRALIVYIIKNQNNISKEFIEKYNKDIDWTALSDQFHNLKEPFMRKFHKYLDWDKISKAQKLST